MRRLHRVAPPGSLGPLTAALADELPADGCLDGERLARVSLARRRPRRRRRSGRRGDRARSRSARPSGRRRRLAVLAREGLHDIEGVPEGEHGELGAVVEVAAEVFAPVDDPPERAGLDLVSERLRDYRFHTYWAGSLTSSGWPTRRSDPTPGWPHSVERPHAGRSTVRRPAHRTASKPRMSADARLSGNGRLRAYAELDCDVARAAVLAVPFACARPASSSPLAWAAKCRIRSTGSTWPPCASAGVDLVVPLAITVALGRPGPRRRRPRCSAMVPALTALVGLSATLLARPIIDGPFGGDHLDLAVCGRLCGDQQRPGCGGLEERGDQHRVAAAGGVVGVVHVSVTRVDERRAGRVRAARAVFGGDIDQLALLDIHDHRSGMRVPAEALSRIAIT